MDVSRPGVKALLVRDHCFKFYCMSEAKLYLQISYFYGEAALWQNKLIRLPKRMLMEICYIP